MNIIHILGSDDKFGSAKCLLDLLEKEIKDDDVYPIVVTPKFN